LFNLIQKEMKKTKVCTKCGRTLPVSEYRVHKSGFVLNQCLDCERTAAKSRNAKRRGIFTVTTKNGKTYQVSTAPMKTGRKVTSTSTDKVLYVGNVSRDEARSIFATYAGVPYTGISATTI
jgi:ssDNA-binding Zn-finger/Zn-ribbon topoisomerase 1